MLKPTDLTFITNEEGQNLLERFKVLIRDTQHFDVLVGYFYSSAFKALYPSLKQTKQIRILIGINTDKKVLEGMRQAKQEEFSHAEAKQEFSQKLIQEMNHSQDTIEVEQGLDQFVQCLQSGQLKIRAYPSRNLHAKLYIMSFLKGDRDKGRVITGSSNFTKAGLSDNLEFNVELKNPSDYHFSLNKFNELWEQGVDLKDSYIKTLKEKTWFNKKISPYEIYLKFLYEHFKEDLKCLDTALFDYQVKNFKQLEYQRQAVANAKRILQEYDGVFLSDVVGLGKTYMSAMLAGQLKGRSLVLAPPLLLKESNPGSWKNVFSDFRIPSHFESLGMLDKVISQGTSKYKNIFIDEAHRFRKEDNKTYEKLSQICRGKKVILVTATPLNNRPLDILAQIKLFQKTKQSRIPNVPDLDHFFKGLQNKIDKIDKKENYQEYIKVTKNSANKIRESVLKQLMVRRTRTEIQTYFAEDLAKQKVKFPQVKDPEPIYYEFHKTENEIFDKTAQLISQKLKYARYMPLTYYKPEQPVLLKKPLKASFAPSQKSLGGIMKCFLVKRLESSFYAFKNSIDRSIKSYELFLKELKLGHVYTSKKHFNKIFELLNNDDEKAIQKLIEQERATKYPAKDFTPDLKKDLEHDLNILQEIKAMWSPIKRDPKLEAFIEKLCSENLDNKEAFPPLKDNKQVFSPLKDNKQVFSPLKDNKQVFPPLKDNKQVFPPLIRGARGVNSHSHKNGNPDQSKLIVFTESKETAEYLGRELNKKFKGKVLVFTGSSSIKDRDKVIANFDPKAFKPKNDCQILITTDVLSEGVNLHRSNKIVNYDLPWNPTRLMQRVGRINRVDTLFKEIYTFNFFPTEQSNSIIHLKEIAKAKITAFINLLGSDARLLTEDETPEGHKLFDRLGSKKSITGEDETEESELKYLKILKDIKEKDPDLFNKIENLPKKARTAKKHKSTNKQLLTYFRKGKIKKFLLTINKNSTGPTNLNNTTKPTNTINPTDPTNPTSPTNSTDPIISALAGIQNKTCLEQQNTKILETKELDFITSAKLLQAKANQEKANWPADFSFLLAKNQQKFLELTSASEEDFISPTHSRNNNESELLKFLKIRQKALKPFTEIQKAYFKQIQKLLEQGALPKHTVNSTLKALKKELKQNQPPQALKTMAILQKNIPEEFIKDSMADKPSVKEEAQEVILSEYLIPQ